MNPSFVTFQQDQFDYGVACLSTILKYHGSHASLDELRHMSGTSKQGTTLIGLMQAAKQIGFEVEGLEAETVHNLQELSHPAILHVTLESKLQHYVVYFPAESKQGALQIMDPAKGLLKVMEDYLDSIWITKALLSLTPTDKIKKSNEQNQSKKAWIIDLIRDDYPVLLIALFVGILISALGLSTALFSQRLIDNILPEGNSKKLILSLILLLLLLLVRSGLQYLRGTFMLRQGMDFNNRIINRFYEKLLRLPKLFFDTRKTGDLIARMHDTRRIQMVLASLSGTVVIDALVIIVSLIFVFTYSVWVGCILLISLPAFSFILLWFNKPIMLAQKETMAGYALAESHFVDSIQGIADIKLKNRQQFFEKLIDHIYGEFQNRVMSLGKVNISFGFWSEVTGVVIMIASFGVASWLVLNKQLQIGEMVALLGMAGSVVPSCNRLVVANIQLQEARVAFDRMFEFASVEKEENQNNEEVSYIESLKLDNISFRFPGRKQILKNINLLAFKGELVGMLGESGQGKTTLMQLLQKFYQPENGNILVNEINLQQLNTNTWRESVGSVSQEPRIFNGTVLFNLALSDDPEIIKSTIEYCESTGMNKFINELPQSYMTIVGDGGINLSGGQKQLLALIRALASKPKLLLLDEPTSSMDKNLEAYVLNLIASEKKDRITILVTHHQSAVSFCDRIYALEDGMVKPKEELMV